MDAAKMLIAVKHALAFPRYAGIPKRAMECDVIRKRGYKGPIIRSGMKARAYYCRPASKEECFFGTFRKLPQEARELILEVEGEKQIITFPLQLPRLQEEGALLKAFLPVLLVDGSRMTLDASPLDIPPDAYPSHPTLTLVDVVHAACKRYQDACNDPPRIAWLEAMHERRRTGFKTVFCEPPPAWTGVGEDPWESCREALETLTRQEPPHSLDYLDAFLALAKWLMEITLLDEVMVVAEIVDLIQEVHRRDIECYATWLIDAGEREA